MLVFFTEYIVLSVLLGYGDVAIYLLHNEPAEEKPGEEQSGFRVVKPQYDVG